jgi:hypothetical protein
MIASTGLEFTRGRMAVNTRATGTTVSSTAKVFIDSLTVSNAVVNGKRVSVWPGWMNSEPSV